MSFEHDNQVRLDSFKAEIKSTVKELIDDPAARWTVTSIAKAGQISRNQLYAWMGQGPQRLKQLPDRDRVLGFYRGIKKSARNLFVAVGWDSPPDEVARPEAIAERQLRLIRARLDQNPPTEERRELEVALVQIEAAKRMQDAADAAAAEALRKYGHGAA